MHRSSIDRITTVLAFFCLCHFSLFSQTISFETPDDFFVCGSASFDVTITNNSGVPLPDVTVEVDFTTSNGTECGVAYLPGTVLNAAEDDLSDLGAPIFSLADLAAGQAVTLTFLAEAPCSVVDCIDGAEFFVNEINLNWTGGSSSTTTNPYVIERALLVITQVENSFMTGSQGDAIQRNITIVNTRPGALQGFLLTDNHQGGITISTQNIGTVITSTNTTFQIALDSTDFMTIGDNDGLFELNETIVITEYIRITDCGVDIPSTVSDITASWGCGGEICQDVATIAIIDIQPSQKAPNLIWEPITSFAECFCGPDAYQQGMKITNVGTGEAIDLVFDMRLLGAVSGGIEVSSIMVDSAGTILDIDPGFPFTYDLIPPCDGTDSLLTGSMILTIPNLGPSQSVTITWDVYFCDVSCNQPGVDWDYRYSYFKPCPPSPFISEDEYIYVSDFGTPFSSSAQLDSMVIFEDGDEATINYELSHDDLSTLTDELVLEFRLDCGLVWDENNELLLSGQAPLNIEVVPDSAFTTVSATYQLPLADNAVSTSFDLQFFCDSLCFEGAECRDTIITSCLEVPCAPPPPPQLPITLSATINKCTDYPLGCNVQTCDFLFVAYECPIDSLCVNEPPGYALFDFTAARKNLGLPDNDNDRQPDGPGFDDLSLVRTDRLIAGDTIRAYLGAEVRMDEAGVQLPDGFIDMEFTASDLTPSNVNGLFTNETGIKEAGITLRIFDASANSYFECTDPASEVTDGSFLNYRYDISAASLGACVPAGFAFEEGDSVIFIGHYRVLHNVMLEPDNNPLMGTVVLRPEIFIFDADSTGAGVYSPISCGCFQEGFELTGYQYTLLPGIYGLPPCDSSQFIGGSLLRFEITSPNFFPFEHRNFIFAEDWRLTLPDEIQLCNARLTFLRFQGGEVIVDSEILDFDLINGAFTFDLTPFQDPPVEEGWAALLQYIFKMECDVTGSQPMTIHTHLDFLNSLPEEEDPLDYEVTANALQALIPNLNLQPILGITDFISNNDEVKIQLFMENDATEVAAQSSGDAPNTWVYITSQTGLVKNFQLIDPNTGDVFPSVNGVFQLGDFPIGIDTLLLCGTNNSCETENFTIHYGWNCDPFTSQIQTACYHRETPLTITSPPGEIDFLVESPTGCFDLCEEIPPYSLEIFNGELGSVYELIAQAQMPPGQTIVPGSSQVEYPTGSGNFFPIDDPVFINSTLAEWNLSNFDSLSRGLPGINELPANSVTLFFATTTECGFVADAFTLFTIAAELNCGIPSNSVAKPGDPICINGVTPSYSTNIDVETPTGFTCSNEMVFEFSMTASQILPAGACVIATLPQGISLVPNSCESACQANFNCTPTIDGNTYTWSLPEGVPSNQIICFEFNTIGWDDLPCGDGLVIFRTANETQALCAETGDSCSTKINTGSLLFQYDIQRPEFELDNFMVFASQTAGDDQIDFSIDITNNGGQNEPPITVDFFVDNDGDGIGDDLVHTENLVAIISNGQTETMTGSFLVPPGNLCNLVAYINPDQCLCSLDSAYVFTPITYQTDQSTAICSGDSLTVGVEAQAGFTYQWLPDDCIAESNEATTIFSCINDTAVPVTYTFTLAESDGNACAINNQVDVTVQPVPGIAFTETPICAGSSANIVATDGVSWLWQGPEIDGSTIQIQTVTPNMSSTYSVTVTDVVGCMGSEEVLIEVNPLPEVDAGDDIFACPGNSPQLNATFNPDWDYLWSPAIVNGQPALSDPTIHNPDVETPADVTFTVEVTDQNTGCTGSDEVFVSQSGAINLMLSPDITICTGGSTILSIDGADNYEWTPVGDCQNPECSAILVSPTMTTTYSAIASTAEGCLDTAFVTVTITDDDIMTFDTLPPICEGESVMIHDSLVMDARTYVDTIDLAGLDCDSISSVTLIVNPVPQAIAIDTSICMGDSVEIFGGIYTEATDSTITLTAVNGCDSTIHLNVEVFEISVEIDSVRQVEVDSVFTLTIDPTTFDSIVWSGGGMGEDCLNDPSCRDSLDMLGEEVIYMATVVDGNGCVATDTHAVRAIIRCVPEQAQVPNVFTPNGDTQNDEFSIVAPNAEEVLQLRVWDRWGRKVYDGPGPWDGTYDGEPAGQDVYIYDILVGCPAGVEADEKLLRGDVTLIR